MTCESCVKDISDSLHKLSGIQKVEANLKDQLVTIEGTGSSYPSYKMIATHMFYVGWY
jgi:copper chaperone CopZ